MPPQCYCGPTYLGWLFTGPSVTPTVLQCLLTVTLVDLASGSQRGAGSCPEQSWGSQAGEVPSLHLLVHSLMNKVFQ